ncbi:MAG TPA: large conductance mechanosensitive channel protein MscL [Bacteroidia bacterium]|nr:large conductance mechanosensitive channel protein MscL [Bacteroidia bacterium]
MLQEFKDFAMKGSVIDLAVGMIIGTAFSAITKSLVADVITPLLQPLLGEVDFADLTLGTVKIGLFINALISFIIMAFVIFMIVRFINKMKKKEEEEKVEEPKGPTELELLQEIANNLKK